MKTKITNWGDDPDLSGPRDWFRNTLIIREVKNRKKKGRLLDFGCGSGNLLLRLANNFNCIGIDASELSINYFNSKIQETQNNTRIKTIIGKEKTILRFSSNTFDVITSGETMEHLKDDKKIVGRFYKILKKGGICVISVPAHQRLWSKFDDYAGHFRRYEKENLIKIFVASGFRIEKIYYWGFPLSRIWHNLIFAPLFISKVEKNKIYSKQSNLIGKIISVEFLRKLFSYPFWFDQFFNWTRFGDGLILVARK